MICDPIICDPTMLSKGFKNGSFISLEDEMPPYELHPKSAATYQPRLPKTRLGDQRVTILYVNLWKYLPYV